MLNKSYQGRYDCPIKFSITNCEAGWTKLEAEINGEHIDFIISGIWQDKNPSNLLQTAYFFNPFLGNFNERMDIDYQMVDQEYKNFADIPLKSEFEWDSEPFRTEWCIYLPLIELEVKEPKLLIGIKKDIGSEQCREYNFEVKYKDFCYAVGKCFSDFIRYLGMEQYHIDSFGDEINLRYLVFAKAYGLGLLANDKSFMDCYKGHKDIFSFKEEMEILAMDM